MTAKRRSLRLISAKSILCAQEEGGRKKGGEGGKEKEGEEDRDRKERKGEGERVHHSVPNKTLD